ncbi:DUF3270 domain-containing protein [Streptococcus macacae]|uniref:PF11674 family protein n=1 Tax=Streptococcus macacae NCTC 11558 TaxID=764298 RepID=G5JYM7_9STRE|nr:DUF3270 domain-containing protein [Streptococcus macacae]EHJ52580.1 hypothetical protein STRMA_0289 [Streptococcus macacae NCTC 11558]SUN78140.1 membrane protein [Streptococcus macacae NCTC 11558]
MPANLNRQPENHEYYDFQEDYTPKYQEFQDFDDSRTKLRELIFFARLAFFCIVTILTCFILLVAKFPPLFAFPSALLISWGVTAAVKSAFKHFKAKQ